MLDTMRGEFSKNLAHTQKQDMMSEVSFQRLTAAKAAEVASATKSFETKSAHLADTNEKVAQAKTDLSTTTEVLSSDEKFLLDLKTRCATSEQDFAARQKTRLDETVAISEAIKILTEDSARDLFSKTVSLIQRGERHAQISTGSTDHSHASKSTAGQSVLRAKAASGLLAAAQQRGALGGWQLATLAVGVQLDDFSKVKEMMDRMVVELKKQQQEEVEKHDACNTDIDTNEDKSRVKGSEQEDLETLVQSHEGGIANLDREISELKIELSEAQVALNSAGETRKAENHEFQQVVADQRATVTVLQKALDRLGEFYGLQTNKAQKSFLQRKAAPPPAGYKQAGAAGEAYAASGGAAGVMQILQKIVQEAKAADEEAVRAESESQAAYEELVANTNGMLSATETAITEKQGVRAHTEAEKLRAARELDSANVELKDLQDQNKALHLGCDYLVKNFNIRQQARQDEVEAIADAKAILSGASLGA